MLEKSQRTMTDQSLIQNVLNQSQSAAPTQAQQQPIDLFASYKRNKDDEKPDEIKKKK